ncbi:MAG: protein-L-isoaspartate(D-aspartate) O-methyltransferase [Actinophytocola sp.]|nr:protein-L-isoaspartate(D-aspartate) O-methyltransferase [Actinophytocola sp.]
MTVEWKPRLSVLADELTAKGKLKTARWQAAFRSTPRHVFVPVYFEQNDTGGWERVTVDHPAALDTVYSNTALFTDVDEHGAGVSSSSMPGLMTRMLELLDVRPGQRVLEIGTGTGYNTALLCSALGDRHVFSIDVDYVAAARERLVALGYRPTLATGDGIGGMPGHAPFDRIIATVAVPHIPAAWVDQLADGGVILADVKPNTTAGNLVVLRKRGDIAEGRFDSGQAWFMSMRHPGQSPDPVPADRHPGPATHSTTRLSAQAWKEQPVPWFLACLDVGRDVQIGYQLGDDHQPTTLTLSAPDGSWAEVDMDGSTDGQEVRQAGPTRLWDAVEGALAEWESAGQPKWDQLGLTVMPDKQWVWLDDPTNVVRRMAG